MKCLICDKDFSPVRKTTKTCSKKCSMHLRYQDPKQRELTSDSVKGKTGGWRNFGGNGNKGTYRGYVYQSSWELAWIHYHLENNIPFRRCTEYFEYVFEGKMRKYFPDFFLIDENRYVEVKGFESPLTTAKLASVPGIKLVGRKEIQPMLDFAGKVFMDTQESSKLQ